MRRWLLPVLLAAAVTPLTAEALVSVWAALSDASESALVAAGGDVVQAALALALAIGVLSLGDGPAIRLMPLLDRRAAHADGDGRTPA